jgi:hypothetical protein
MMVGDGKFSRSEIPSQFSFLSNFVLQSPRRLNLVSIR